MTRFRVLEVRTGKAVPFGPKGAPSAIVKEPVPRPVRAGVEGFEGDEQGDRKNHGGPDKAVHAYPAPHARAWAEDLPECADLFFPGAFGENLPVEGVVETDIHMGDRWRVGGALFEVSQARQPCWKLNVRFDRPDMARRVQETGRTGWYFRVIEEGAVAAGDEGRLLDRPHEDWSLDRVARLLYRDTLDFEALAEFAGLPGLPESWRRLAEKRLAKRAVEDWASRVETPNP